jgi:hypothetical protein
MDHLAQRETLPTILYLSLGCASRRVNHRWLKGAPIINIETNSRRRKRPLQIALTGNLSTADRVRLRECILTGVPGFPETLYNRRAIFSGDLNLRGSEATALVASKKLNTSLRERGYFFLGK